MKESGLRTRCPNSCQERYSDSRQYCHLTFARHCVAGIGDRLERNCPLFRVDQALVVEDCVRLAFLRWVAYW